VQKINEVLDRMIRPALQGDGGDIEVIDYKDNVLTVFFQGACGGCPSSTAGTLSAIEATLREEFNPQIQVVPSM
jgi:Fe-S cluster biogenesis protein NfuA